jgi:rfaE bifunctional protein nucleotidyltransferase chain/domain
VSTIPSSQKLLSRAEFIAARGCLRAQGRVVVFTNGCFDLLHRAHVECLREARGFGDALFVGVNSDAGVRTLKGSGRPLMSVEDRVSLLAEMQCVDRLCVFPEAGVEVLVTELLPDVLVKGGDYLPDDIVGREAVEAAGGEVRIASLWPGCSTSQLIQRIRRLPDD